MILARRTLALLLVLPGCGLFDPTTDGNGGPRPSDPTTDLARIALQAHDQVRASASPTPNPALPTMQWSAEVEGVATAWAAHCVYEHNAGRGNLGENIAELVRMALRYEGWEVDVAHNGTKAVATAKASRPDAVVLDMVLPRLNGYEFLQELRERGVRDLGVVVVSGFGPVSRFVDRFPLVRAVVQKPVDLEVLLEAVQSCVVAHAAPEPAR